MILKLIIMVGPARRVCTAALGALCLLLGACSSARVTMDTGSIGTQVVPGAGTSITTSRLSAGFDTTLGAAMVIGILLADGLHWYRQTPDGRRLPIDAREAAAAGVQPPRVNVQDCTQPVDVGAGNLVCR